MEKKLLLPKHSSIKHKLIVLIGGQFLLYFILLYALLYQFQDMLEDKIGRLAHQTVKTVTGNVDIHFNNNIGLLNVMVSDSSLIRLLRNHPDFSKTSSIWAQVQIIEKLKTMTTGSYDVYGVSIYNPKSNKILSTREGLVVASEQIAAWHKEMENRAEALAVRTDLRGSKPVLRDNESQIYLLRTIPGNGQNNMLIIHTTKQVLHLMMGDVGLWEGTAIVMTDMEGNLVFQSGNKIDYSPGLKFSMMRSPSSSYEKLVIDNTPYIAVQEYSELTNWNVTMIIPQKEIMQNVVQLRDAAIVIAVMLGLFFVILTSILYSQIINPIKRLKHAIMTVEKGLAFEAIPIKRMDEFGYLQHRFNEIISNEQRMRHLVVEERLHKKEIELKFLQSQVNPHFLYNTLDSIYWVAVEKDNDEIGDVVLDLSRYFRLSLSRGQEFVTIRETIDHLDYYIRIQQFRHLNKFQIEWKIERELEDLRIMKLMLQPIVENAIIHGLERKVEDCSLTIEIKASGDEIVFRIQDTGIGIERGRLKRLLKEIKLQEGPSEATYGLRNLYQRLKLKYGENMRFHMSSLPQQGTRVTIRIRSIYLKGGDRHESHHSRG